MQAVVTTIIPLVIGVIVAILVSRHYYTRTVKHRLAVYYIPSPSIFFGVDADIRNELTIQYRGEKVNELSVIEFLVANEGADAVRDAIKPLTFDMGSNCRLVDASVTYIQPEGREIDVERYSERQFSCIFPLLNSDEYFYVKVIADGLISISEIKCTITAENLPPRIDIESTARVSIGPDERRSDITFLIPAAIIFLVGAVLTLPLVGLYEVHPAYFPFAWSKWDFVWWLTVPIFLAGIIGGLFLIGGLIMAVMAFVGDIPRRPHFKGPRHAAYPPHYLYRAYRASEAESALTRYPREDDDPDRWETGFRYLQEYVEKNGHPRVPQSYVVDGYRLGNWVNMQRINFARATLDDDRRTRLQGLPGWS